MAATHLAHLPPTMALTLTLIYLLASEYKRIRPFSAPFSVSSAHILTEPRQT
jgi:hypothetical protein